MAVKPQIWGHRGAYSDAPESTLEGFRLAAELGADGVELDIQLSKDGEIVVIHDETADRTNKHTGKVCDYTLAELKRIDVNNGAGGYAGKMEIPALAEVFGLLSETRLTVNVELKTGTIWYEGIESKALTLAKEFGLLERVVWSSFNHYSVQEIKRLEPSAQTALLCGGGILVTGEQCEKTGVQALHCEIRQLSYPGLAEDCRARGIRLRPWTVNRDGDLRLCAELQVDAVITDNIGRAKAVMNINGNFS